jgi:hypothetical protein
MAGPCADALRCVVLLQGVVAEATSVLGRLSEVVEEFHRHGLFLFTWGDVNNNMDNYLAQARGWPQA